MLIKKLSNKGFVINSFEYHATIEFPNVSKEFCDAIDSDIADWIAYKHSTIKKRKLTGSRKKLSLDISDQTSEELVCIELKPSKFR